MAFTIQLATKTQLENWDKVIGDFEGGTLFHERRFLSYHGDRFKSSECFLVINKGEAVFGLLPAIISQETGRKELLSPFGGSFGGPAFKSTLSLKDAIGIMDLYHEFFAGAGISRISLTIPPSLYSRNTELLEYCLLKKGYTIGKADVFTILPIGATAAEITNAYEGRVRTALRKEKDQYKVRRDADIETFYEILLIDKGKKNTVPTHSQENLHYLKAAYPDRIQIDIATHKPTGARFAVCYFRVSKNGWMTFYIAQDQKDLRLNGITVLLDEFLHDQAGNATFLDFGGSTFGYEISNIGVADFKESFGAKSYLRKTFTCNLY